MTEVTSDTVTLRDTVSGTLVPATVSYDAARRNAQVRIGQELGAQRTYELAVGNGLRDPAGNLIAPVSWTFTTGSYGFYDVVDSPFQSEIGWLVLSGITNGCGDGIYCPTAPVTRDQMASFLVRAMSLPGTSTDFFTDDDASPHESNINRLAAAHLTNGCGPGRYCPTEKVTRAQMASFLVRALKLPAVSTDLFGDDTGSIHEADINALAAAGITSGCGPGRFCPDGIVTREQMAAFLERAFG